MAKYTHPKRHTSRPKSGKPAFSRLPAKHQQPATDDQFLANHAAAIRQLGRQTVDNVCEIGRRLIEVNERLEHGRWLPWLKREFGWSETTARRFMQLYALAQVKSSKLADLDVPLSGLYLLAEPGTPNRGAGRDPR